MRLCVFRVWGVVWFNPLMLQLVAWAQAVYFVVTGVWPLVHMRSFVAVTGPKVDLWLVRTVAVLVLAVGLAIGLAAWRHEVSAAIVLLGIGSAAGLAGIDVVYVSKRVIAKIYLADAVGEVILIVGWMVGMWA